MHMCTAAPEGGSGGVVASSYAIAMCIVTQTHPIVRVCACCAASPLRGRHTLCICATVRIAIYTIPPRAAVCVGSSLPLSLCVRVCWLCSLLVWCGGDLLDAAAPSASQTPRCGVHCVCSAAGAHTAVLPLRRAVRIFKYAQLVVFLPQRSGVVRPRSTRNAQHVSMPHHDGNKNNCGRRAEAVARFVHQALRYKQETKRRERERENDTERDPTQ